MNDISEMKAVILCGGQGTRFREETEFKPKPLIEIGGKPILWHIMKIYSHYGIKNFVLLLGYKGFDIKSFFLHYKSETRGFTINLKGGFVNYLDGQATEDWNVTMLDTGQESLTEKRLCLAKKFLENDETFMLTYGDGVADINIAELLKFHNKQKVPCTITGVKPISRFGKIIHKAGIIEEFREKPVLNDIINGGFMVFNNDVFDYVSEDNVMLEHVLLPKLVKQKKAAIYKHDGFWHCMDTYRDKQELEKMWQENPKWKIWND